MKITDSIYEIALISPVGRGINNDQRTEELIGPALKELALG